MTRSFLVIASVLWATAARGEWKLIGAPPDAVPQIAYDTARVQYEPPLVTTWTRVVLPDAATLGNGVRYRSVLQKVAIDCNARTWAVTRSEFYAERGATGTALYTDSLPRQEWELRHARPGSNGDRLIRALCTTPAPW